MERRQAILRALFVKVEAQLSAEGIAVPFEVIVAENTLAKDKITRQSVIWTALGGDEQMTSNDQCH